MSADYFTGIGWISACTPCMNNNCNHTGSKWLKPTEIKLPWCDFTSFSKQVSANSHNFCFQSFRALHIENVSNCCRHKDDQPISRVFSLIFGGFFAVWLNFVHGPSVKELHSAQGPFCSVYLFSVTLLKRFTFPWNLFAHNHWSAKNLSRNYVVGIWRKNFW